MALNLSAAYLEAKKAPVVLLFSRTVTTNSISLQGGGGASGNGFPIPVICSAVTLFVYDGNLSRSSSGNVQLIPGDRISLYATYSAGSFSVEVVKNGNPTGLNVTNCNSNTILYASLLIQLKES